MLLDLEPIFNQEGASLPLDLNFEISDDLIGSPVHLKGLVQNRTGIVRIDAAASYTCSAQCARCNKKILRKIEVPIRHILVPRSENEEEEDDYIVLEDLQLDPEALASEDIFLEMPSRFLCREDCRGLCPVCGSDLNERDCGCRPATDARWDALKELFE